MPSVMLLACQPPFAAGSIMIWPDPELLGLTDVTSNAALPVVGIWPTASSGRTFSTPTMSGAMSAADAVAARRHFFHALSADRGSFFMMCSILFFKSEPVTPATHASGDSTQNWHVFRMPSAYV